MGFLGFLLNTISSEENGTKLLNFYSKSNNKDNFKLLEWMRSVYLNYSKSGLFSKLNHHLQDIDLNLDAELFCLLR